MASEADRNEMTLWELAERAGVTPRTVRFYIAQGLLPAPKRVGRGACYGREHLDRIRELRRLKAAGRTLAEIRAEEKMRGVVSGPASAARAWRHYELAEDVVVMVREDVAPWRARRLRQWMMQWERQDELESKE